MATLDEMLDILHISHVKNVDSECFLSSSDSVDAFGAGAMRAEIDID